MLAGYIKEFLKNQLSSLEKKVQESPTKIDDKVWEVLKPMLVKWIDSL